MSQVSSGKLMIGHDMISMPWLSWHDHVISSVKIFWPKNDQKNEKKWSKTEISLEMLCFCEKCEKSIFRKETGHFWVQKLKNDVSSSVDFSKFRENFENRSISAFLGKNGRKNQNFSSWKCFEISRDNRFQWQKNENYHGEKSTISWIYWCEMGEKFHKKREEKRRDFRENQKKSVACWRKTVILNIFRESVQHCGNRRDAEVKSLLKGHYNCWNV